MSEPATEADSGNNPLDTSLNWAIQRLEQARPFAKINAAQAVLDLARRRLQQTGGAAYLYGLAPRLDRAGVFEGTDWASPQNLIAGLVQHSLAATDRRTVTLECLSLLRNLAVANEDMIRPGFSAEQAHHFLTQVLAHNLKRLFGDDDEASRLRQDGLGPAIGELFHFLVEHIGYRDIIGSLCDEIWRVLGQRPIQVFHAKSMITQIALTLAQSEKALGDARLGADRLISALFGPTQHCRDDPGLDGYAQRLDSLDNNQLQQEALGFARAMHDTGLVSDYHVSFLRWLMASKRHDLIGETLGLSSTGLDSLRCYQELVLRLIDDAIHPATAQAVYGLTQLLERGALFMPSVAPGLWRQIGLNLSSSCDAMLQQIFGPQASSPVHLLAAVICVLGQPLGVGQGNNPSCQSARAISMWALNDPDYLLHLIAQAARYDQIHMQFEGENIDSGSLPVGLMAHIPQDNDPVSTLLVPHLDRIYAEMCRRCADRTEDPHSWVNPECHGWWVGRGFAIAVDVQTGQLRDYERFVRHFFASYNPLYNGNQPVIHPQPAGLAVTDSAGRFVGWHAITLLRVAMDMDGRMRAYFYNPNNDSGQNWGQDIVVSTAGHGERYGESSLPFPQLASRIYIFHDEPYAKPDLDAIPADKVDMVMDLAINSWAHDRVPTNEPVPSAQ